MNSQDVIALSAMFANKYVTRCPDVSLTFDIRRAKLQGVVRPMLNYNLLVTS